MQENAEDNNSEDGHFLRSEMFDRDLNMRLCEQWEKAAIWKMQISRKAVRLMLLRWFQAVRKYGQR